jgi:hypothetical protein
VTHAKKMITAVFHNPEDAEAAYGWLVQQGYGTNEINALKGNGVVVGVRPRGDEDARAIQGKFRELHGENTYSTSA